MWISNALNYFITCSCPLSPWFQMWPQLFHHHFPMLYYCTVMYTITLSKIYILWNTYIFLYRRIQFQNKICFLSLMTTSHTATSYFLAMCLIEVLMWFWTPFFTTSCSLNNNNNKNTFKHPKFIFLILGTYKTPSCMSQSFHQCVC